MPKTANTAPKQIVDVTGKTTTVHAKVSNDAPSASARKLAGVSTPPSPSSEASHVINDEIFNTITIGKNAAGKPAAWGSTFFGEYALEAISDELDGESLGDFLRTNGDEIRKYLMAEYGASVVNIHDQTAEIELRFEVEVDSDKIDPEEALDALYNRTRVTAAHSHAFTSDELAWGIQAHLDAADSDVETFVPRGTVYELDD